MKIIKMWRCAFQRASWDNFPLSIDEEDEVIQNTYEHREICVDDQHISQKYACSETCHIADRNTRLNNSWVLTVVLAWLCSSTWFRVINLHHFAKGMQHIALRTVMWPQRWARKPSVLQQVLELVDTKQCQRSKRETHHSARCGAPRRSLLESWYSEQSGLLFWLRCHRDFYSGMIHGWFVSCGTCWIIPFNWIVIVTDTDISFNRQTDATQTLLAMQRPWLKHDWET